MPTIGDVGKGGLQGAIQSKELKQGVQRSLAIQDFDILTDQRVFPPRNVSNRVALGPLYRWD